jgi:hypothetical protein
MCGVVECAILSVDKKGKQKEIHTYGVATSGDAGSSRICLPEFQHRHFGKRHLLRGVFASIASFALGLFICSIFEHYLF